jgi:putative tryptophan/tyrosine transport system substrate-binding protein
VEKRKARGAKSKGQYEGREFMRKNIIGLTLCAAVFALCLPVEAQQPTKVRKIGFPHRTGAFGVNIQEFRQGLRELGYIEGQNIMIEFRSGERAQLAQLANELVQQKVEVIVAAGPGANAAKTATETIPIVFTFSGDPIEAGLIDSLARPGRNMTGITWLSFELVGKRLEILKEAVPRVSRVGVLASPAHPGEQRELRATQSTAKALGITLQYNQVEDTADVDVAFDTIIKDKANALLVFPDPVTNEHRTQIAKFAVKHRLPSMFGRKEAVEAGGLISYGAKLEEVYRRIPVHVDKILKGAKPADVPTELPTKFEMFINLKTAKQIGLTMPPNLLVRADKVIKLNK